MALENNLKLIRTEKHIRQETLANAIGVHPKSISRIENGERNPSLEIALRLSHYLGCSVEQIFRITSDY